MRRSLDAVSVLSADDLADYDVISDGIRSMESSTADLASQHTAGVIYEPPPSQEAKVIFGTPAFSAEDIQTYVQKALGSGDPSVAYHKDTTSKSVQVRVYVDGPFDGFNVAHALQLRQAKLSFPSVHLMVGVYSDNVCREHRYQVSTPHLERCEVLRHCRWVDEVLPDAPWQLDEAFIRSRRIDFVAIDEGTSIDPSFNKERLKGYDLVKSRRQAIPTRRSIGVLSRDRKFSTTPVQTTPSTQLESTQNTLRGVPPALQDINKSESVTKDQVENPFEEPKVDMFGIGHGV